MSGFELWTWVSIVVLVFGSVAVFLWFLADVRAWFRSHPRRDRRD